MLQESAIAPVRGTNPNVGRNPVQPQRVLGDEMEPSVSDPIAKTTHPAATAEAEPAEEPLDPCAGFQGLRVLPPNQRSSMASAPSVSFATSTAPALSSRRTTVASSSNFCSSNPPAPQVVIAGNRQQILCAPRQSMQGSPMLSRGKIAVGFFRFCQGSFLGQRDHKIELPVVALQALQIHFRQRQRGNLPAPYQLAQLARRSKAKILEIFRHAARRERRSGRHFHRPFLG